MKKFSFITIGATCLLGLSNYSVVHASINEKPYDVMQQAWAKTVYEAESLIPSNSDPMLPNIPIAFPNQQDAYKSIKPFALTTPPQNNGYYPSAQYVTLDGDPNETETTVSMAGAETLTNDLDTTTNLVSNGASYSTTNGTSVTTTNAFDLGISNSATFNIFFVKDKTTVSAKYDYSKANTVTNATTVTYNIPSQTIPVKPGHTVVVDYVMTLGKATGNLNINGQITGNSPLRVPGNSNGKYTDREFTNVGDAVKRFSYAGYKSSPFTYVSPRTVNYVGGHATYTSSLYSNSQLRVYDQTTGETSFYAVKGAQRTVK